MKIRSIESENFKSFKSLKIENIGEINTIIGQNSSGKSNVLQLIRLFFKIILNNSPNTNIDLIQDLWHQKDTTKPIKISLSIELNESDKKNIKFSTSPIKFKVNADKTQIEPISYPSQKPLLKLSIEIDYQKKWKINELSFDGNDEISSLDNIKTFFEDKIHYISITRNQSEGEGIFERNPIIPKELTDELITIEEDLDDNKKERIRTNLRRILRKSTSISKHLRGISHKMIIDIDDVGRIPIGEIGGGDQEFLQIIYELINPKYSIFLIEEPEVHLHNELQRQLYKIFENYSNKKQFFLTTHSTVFIDKSKLENTYIVENNDIESKIKRISSDNDLNNLLNLLGIKPSDIFFAENILFVEGESDRIFYSNIADKLGDSFSKNNVAVFSIGGKSKGKRHLGLWNKITKSIEIPKFFILDNDAIEEAKEIQKQDSGVKLTVLDKGEIEDYYPSDLILNGLQSIYDLKFNSNEEKNNYKTELEGTNDNTSIILKILGEKKILSKQDMKDKLKKLKWKFDLAEYVSLNIAKKDIHKDIVEAIHMAIINLR